MHPFILSVLLAMLGSAYSKSNEAELASSNKQMASDVHQPLEKAKAVEQEILNNAEMQRKQMENL